MIGCGRKKWNKGSAKRFDEVPHVAIRAKKPQPERRENTREISSIGPPFRTPIRIRVSTFAHSWWL